MYKADANCYELTEQTAIAIDDDTLRLLFVSTQQNNLMLCIKYAVAKWVYCPWHLYIHQAQYAIDQCPYGWNHFSSIQTILCPVTECTKKNMQMVF